MAVLAALSLIAALAAILAPAPVSADPYGNFSELVPGSDIRVEDSAGNASGCTLGPYVSIKGESVGALTAGHCGQDGDRVYWRGTQVGTLWRPVKRDHFDYGIIVPVTGHESVFSNPDLAGAYRPVSFYFAEELAQRLAEGAQITACSYGATTGRRCGPLRASDTDNWIITADFPSDHGDSGGPVWADTPDGTWVIGTLVARYDGTGRSIVVPIAESLYGYGVKLSVHRA
jgi:hypothetical protein